jgi:hypothetical protein
MRRYRHGVSLLAAVLSGCLASEEPLIGDAASVAPLADGTYSYVDDGSEREVVVSHHGGVTRIVSDDEAPEGSEVRMAKLRRGYYVVMSQEDDDEYLYTLARVARRQLTFYKTEYNCDRLQELWLVGGKTPADVGITEIEEGAIATCVFRRYEDVARAVRDLLADGRLEPSLVLTRKPR